MDRVPSHCLLVPGPWRDADEVIAALASAGLASRRRDGDALSSGEIGVELIEDAELAAGFGWGRSGPLPAELVERVAACPSAALVEVGQRLDEDPERVAVIGRALRDAGGVAVRMEASAAASEWDPWLERLESGLPARVYASSVVLVGDDDGSIFTCGMHQFDLPDAQIGGTSPQPAARWLDLFCIYQLAENPVLTSGHTFALDADSPRRTLERWPDHRHHPDDGRHNPFGVWRFLAEGEAGVDVMDPVPTIIPPLVVLLRAAEGSREQPLTREEVETLVGEAPSIAMSLPDAMKLERTRGYADIEPQRAWERWQIVRATL